jgi:hypothetical protein
MENPQSEQGKSQDKVLLKYINSAQVKNLRTVSSAVVVT